MTAKATTGFDRDLGSRVKIQRNVAGMTQMRLADALGITFQQVQKYENGTNRISVNRLQQIANVLGISVADLTQQRLSDNPAAEDIFRCLETKGAVEMLRYWSALDPSLRKKCTALMKEVAGTLE